MIDDEDRDLPAIPAIPREVLDILAVHVMEHGIGYLKFDWDFSGNVKVTHVPSGLIDEMDPPRPREPLPPAVHVCPRLPEDPADPPEYVADGSADRPFRTMAEATAALQSLSAAD
jgi:hypothetical protein